MRHIGMDILRLLAILLVIGRHLDLPEDSTGFLKYWQTGGWIGVDLFFVLSGYLVSSLLFREWHESNAINIRRFLMRRAWRILPAFWLCVSVSLIVQLWLGTPPKARELIGEAFFLQNYLGGIWPHTWSLAVEAHFYLALPFALLWLAKHRRGAGARDGLDRLPKVVVAVAMGCLGLRIISALVFPRFHAYIDLFGTHIRIDALLFGVCLAWLARFRDAITTVRRIPRFILPLIGCLLLAPAFFFPLEQYRWVSVFGVVLFYLGSGCLLVSVLAHPIPHNSITRFLAVLGAASYTIYLWHFPVLKWCCPAVAAWTGNNGPLLQVITAIAGSCAIGWIIHELVERPVQGLRNRLYPSRSPAIPSTQNANESPAPMRSAA